MQSLPDDLVGDVRPVKVAGVDMVHAGCDSLAEDGDGAVRVLGWPKYAGAGQLHCAVADPLDRQGCAGEREPSAERAFTYCITHFVVFLQWPRVRGLLGVEIDPSFEIGNQPWF
jgi:hypothetical protein